MNDSIEYKYKICFVTLLVGSERRVLEVAQVFGLPLDGLVLKR